jgi:hypothetical protein
MTIETKFEIGQSIKIDGLGGFSGTVIGFHLELKNFFYIVEYWAEWNIKIVQLSENEISHV